MFSWGCETGLSPPVKYFTDSSKAVLPLWIFYGFFSVLCLLCLHARLFICALWSPAGKGLNSWLSFVVSNCEFVTFPLVRYLIVSIPDLCTLTYFVSEPEKILWFSPQSPHLDVRKTGLSRQTSNILWTTHRFGTCANDPHMDLPQLKNFLLLLFGL